MVSDQVVVDLSRTGSSSVFVVIPVSFNPGIYTKISIFGGLFLNKYF